MIGEAHQTRHKKKSSDLRFCVLFYFSRSLRRWDGSAQARTNERNGFRLTTGGYAVHTNKRNCECARCFSSFSTLEDLLFGLTGVIGAGQRLKFNWRLSLNDWSLSLRFRLDCWPLVSVVTVRCTGWLSSDVTISACVGHFGRRVGLGGGYGCMVRFSCICTKLSYGIFLFCFVAMRSVCWVSFLS